MALGSSVVNKSSKKLAPKAPAQRRKPADGPPQPAPAEPPKQTPESRPSVAPDVAPTSAVKDVTPAVPTRPEPPKTAERRPSHVDDIDSDRPNKRRKIDNDGGPATTITTVFPEEAQASPNQAAPPTASAPDITSVIGVPRASPDPPNAPTTGATRANTDGYLPTPESTQVEQPARAPSVSAPVRASTTRATSQPPRDNTEEVNVRAPVTAETLPRQASDATAISTTKLPAVQSTTLIPLTPQVPAKTATIPTNVPTVQTTTQVPATPRGAKGKATQPVVAPASTPKATVTELAKQKARADRARVMISPEATQAQDVDIDDELPPIGFAPAIPRPAGSPTLEDAEALLALRNANTDGFINVEQDNARNSGPAPAGTATQKKAAASKPRKPRQKKAATTNEIQEGEESGSQPAPAKKPRAPRKKKAALSAERVTEDGDDVDADGMSADVPAQTTGGTEQQTAPAKAKKPRKPRKKPETSEDDPQAAGTAPKTNRPRKPRAKAANLQSDGATAQTDGEPPIDPALLQGENAESADPIETAQDGANQNEDDDDTPARSRRGRKPRSPTPSDAEDVEIDPTAVSMMDLTVDMRQGKVSKRERAMREINWVEVAARRREAEAEAKAKAIAGEGPGAETADDREREAEEEARRRDNGGPSRGPQLKLVNGVMVLDTDSLIMDNRNRLDDNSNAVEEENDLTKKVTSHSWLYDNRRAPEERFASTMKSDPWSSEQTDAFYDALRMFGTDFFIISKMFPGKTRRHIKLKFVREERADPERVKSALIGEVKEMDMSVYCEATGLDEDHFKNPEELEEELRQAEEAQKEEIEQAKADAVKKAEDKQTAAKEKSTRVKRGKKKQNTDAGDPEIIIG